MARFGALFGYGEADATAEECVMYHHSRKRRNASSVGGSQHASKGGKR
jgi:hypothetical protein